MVDTGESKVSCSPMSTFPARVIIIASHNVRHWGGEEFEKFRGGQSGVFHFYPLWNLSELLCSSDYFPTNALAS